MSLIAHYPLIKSFHVALVIVSGALFVIRGASVLTRQQWPMQRRWRLTSYAIDTGLLIAGITLWVLLQVNPIVEYWLGFKLCLLLIYIVLGSYALKRGRSFLARLICYVAAIALYLFIVSIAINHHPLGLMQHLATSTAQHSGLVALMARTS